MLSEFMAVVVIAEASASASTCPSPSCWPSYRLGQRSSAPAKVLQHLQRFLSRTAAINAERSASVPVCQLRECGSQAMKFGLPVDNLHIQGRLLLLQLPHLLLQLQLLMWSSAGGFVRCCCQCRRCRQQVCTPCAFIRHAHSQIISRQRLLMLCTRLLHHSVRCSRCTSCCCCCS